MPDILTADDHARGCPMREAACSCGYEDRVAAEIERLRSENERLREWKETVRDIYDKALTADPAQCDLVGWVIGTIEARHPEFFCGKPASDQTRGM